MKMTKSDIDNSAAVHATLVRVHGIGLLLTGSSAVGKSEAALDLITRTHQLVCDDLVRIHFDDVANGLFALRNDKFPHQIAIRGIGFVDIAKTFGNKYTAESSSIDVVVELVRSEPIANFECVGEPKRFYTILEHDIPLFRIPIHPGKNTSAVLEALALKMKSEIAENKSSNFPKDASGLTSRALA